MQMLLSIALGGAVGAVARHLLAGRVTAIFGSAFPYGTVVVNVFGSFILGLVIITLATRFELSQEWRGFIVVGVLGGFTTFSAFSLETALLIERSELMQAALYIGSSVGLSILSLFIGIWLGRMFA
jgi:CrcB protein